MSLMVVNESQLLRSASVPPTMPYVDATITLRYLDVDKVAGIVADVTGGWMGGWSGWGCMHRWLGGCAGRRAGALPLPL